MVSAIGSIIYPRQYQTNCSPAIPLIHTVHLIQPLQPLTAHKQQKYNFTLQNPRENIRSFPKKFQIPLSLSPPKSFCPKSLSLSHHLRRWYAGKTRPFSCGERPHLVGKPQSFRYSLVLSLSLAASLFLSPHLSHLTGGSAAERDDAVFSHFCGNN